VSVLKEALDASEVASDYNCCSATDELVHGQA